MHENEEYIELFPDRYKLIYRYFGFIDHDKITHILGDLKTSLDIEFNLKKRIYSVVNELLENALIHQREENKKVEVVILRSDECFRIVTFNKSSDAEASDLMEYSSDINSLTDSEIKQQYKQKILTGTINKKGTIGVGMELIRLKSKNKILISTEEEESEKTVIIDVRIDFN